MRIHVRHLDQGEWVSLSGILLTKPPRIASDLIRSREDPEAVAQVVADALRRRYASPGDLAIALAPNAAAHGFPRRDGTALLEWLLDLAGDPDTSKWISQARAQDRGVS